MSQYTSEPLGRIPVVNVQPVVDGGRWTSRAVVGEAVPVSATVFREGHDAASATAVLINPDGKVVQSVPMRPGTPGLDQWHARVVPNAEGLWSFRVEGWSDPYRTWAHSAGIKIRDGIDVELMLAEGVVLFERWAKEATKAASKKILKAVAKGLANVKLSPHERMALTVSNEIRDLHKTDPLREFVSASPNYQLLVDRPLALAGSWYEFFPRSEGARFVKSRGQWKSGTFKTAAKRLPAIKEMGFDVVYLTPIHPIGTAHRKGKNNSLTAVEGDPGSPYAIGSAEGGHDAIHPDLGTFADFRWFIRQANKLGMEVAMDIALQCSPDHPWVKDHPEWFTTRVDGTIAYAENPPKKYQDIYPLNFDNDPEGIYQEILRILLLWIDQGVTAFRVDNPHTKSLDFWERILCEIRESHPEVIFLSEAFTRPAMMHTLAKIGYHQSYTYFTWRVTKDELAEYFSEVSGAAGAYMRPSFWPTTHDILPPYLTHGGIAAFAVRAVLAATGSPTWGIYSGYELAERVPRPGVEEQIDNEKYEFVSRDWSKADDIGISTLITALNQIRKDHPALQQLRNFALHHTDNDQVLAYSRHLSADVSPTGEADTVLVIVNLDPHHTQETSLHLDLEAIDVTLGEGESLLATDLLSGEAYTWGRDAFVRLDPMTRVAHVISLRKQ